MAEETNTASLNSAIEALKTYDWGTDIAVLEPIDKAIQAGQGSPATRKELESRLAAVLNSNAPRAAKDFVCRKLALVGTSQSVPAFAGLLANEELSHMARYALERIPGPEAGKALRDAIPRTQGKSKIGVIYSVGLRRDSAAAARLATLLKAEAPDVAAAAARALGQIGNSAAAKALGGYRQSAPKEFQRAAADACLRCAERLAASGKRDEAVAMLRPLAMKEQPASVRRAAERALSAGERS